MGCNKCKKKEKDISVEAEEIVGKNAKAKVTINGITDNVTEKVGDNIVNQSFIIRLVTFLLLVVGFPIIYVAVVVMIFFQFFLPKKKSPNLFKGMIEMLVTKYAMFKAKRELRRREKEFEKNRSYDGDSELLDIEVFETTENNVEDDEN
jgi:hypothetical protein